MWRQVVLISLSLCCVAAQFTKENVTILSPTGAKVWRIDGWTPLKSYNSSTLYTAAINSNNPYQSNQPLYLLDLHGSYYQQGYAYGVLLGQQSVDDFFYLMKKVFPEQWMIDIVEVFLQWQWDQYLSKQLPQQFEEELNGLDHGGRSVGVHNVRRLAEYGVTLANFPGAVALDILVLMINELESTPGKEKQVELLKEMGMEKILETFKLANLHFPIHCSMMGAWGNRTKDSQLFTFRNLDWLANSGISNNKLITVYNNCSSTTYTYLTIGFAGFVGALTGMNEMGITAHEAGLNQKLETFDGFTWPLRLRWILENSKNLDQVMTLWNSTNNTVGVNHGFGSASDNEFIALETMEGYTAEFHADDPREKNYWTTNPNGEKIKMGFPMKEALWRTNHVYDPVMVENELFAPDSYHQDTEKRYMIIHDALFDYELRKVKMDVYDAINITSCAGIKGPDFYSCSDVNGGTDILSVVYTPGKLHAHISFEEGGMGTNQTWSPASCGTYLLVDFSKWLKNQV